MKKDLVGCISLACGSCIQVWKKLDEYEYLLDGKLVWDTAHCDSVVLLKAMADYRDRKFVAKLKGFKDE